MGQGTVMFNFYRKGLLGFLFIIALRGGVVLIFDKTRGRGGVLEIILYNRKIETCKIGLKTKIHCKINFF